MTFVLQPRRDGRFSVVDYCFYDGAMYGELAKPVDEHAEIFTLATVWPELPQDSVKVLFGRISAT